MQVGKTIEFLNLIDSDVWSSGQTTTSLLKQPSRNSKFRLRHPGFVKSSWGYSCVFHSSYRLARHEAECVRACSAEGDCKRHGLKRHYSLKNLDVKNATLVTDTSVSVVTGPCTAITRYSIQGIGAWRYNVPNSRARSDTLCLCFSSRVFWILVTTRLE